MVGEFQRFLMGSLRVHVLFVPESTNPNQGTPINGASPASEAQAFRAGWSLRRGRPMRPGLQEMSPGLVAP